MTRKDLATAVFFLGIILPGTITLIFKNGCTQNNTSSARHSRTNSPASGDLLREGGPGNPSTDISRNLLHHAATTQKDKANEIP